jgi:hypothetical protein
MKQQLDMRQAAAELVKRTRASQGLPMTIADPAIMADLTRLLRPVPAKREQ